MPYFKAKKHLFNLDKKTYLMGILNVTPDSFSDGGKYFQTEDAVQRMLEMQEQGVDMIDVGAQSTRPGFTKISAEEELERLLPVLKALEGKLKITLSVDTFYPKVATAALENGADILNDVNGFSDPEMLQLASTSSCGCIIMHHGGDHDIGREDQPILLRVRSFFQQKLAQAVELGIQPERICFDPGIGFGKTYAENLSLLANVDSIKIEKCALLMAASRKRVIGQPCGNPPFEDRLFGTIAAHTIAVVGGANFLRIHDVPQAVQAVRVADAILLEKRNGGKVYGSDFN